MNVLEWKTTKSNDHDCFIIERKFDTGDFKQIGKVIKLENAYTNTLYKYADYDVLQKGIYFYRLKQVKNDGSFSYQRLVKIFVFDKENSNDMNYESQHTENNFLIEVEIPGSSTDFLKIEVQNEIGNIVVSEIINTRFKSQLLEHHMNLSTLPIGSYDVIVQLNNKISHRRFVKA